MLTTRQKECLRGIGIDIWTERQAASAANPDNDPSARLLTEDDIEDIRRFANQAELEPVSTTKAPENKLTEVPVEAPTPVVETLPKVARILAFDY